MNGTTTMEKGAQQFEQVCAIVERFERDPARLIPILQAVQDKYSYLPEEVLVYVATALGIPPARVYGVASFYAHFALQPKGRYVIRLCDGTACHVKGSMSILEALRARLGLSEQQPTSPDLMFTLETVSCLGACGLAPALVINEEVHGQVTPESAVALVEAIMERERQGGSE